MDARSEKSGAPVAADEYAARLGKLNALQDADRRRDRLFGMAKLAVAVCALAMGAFAIHHIVALAPLLVLVLSFLMLFVTHERVLHKISRRGRTIRYYEGGLARLRAEWPNRSETGERYLIPSHVYARDLDVFGSASLFQYLCTARTRCGEDTLARWLMDAAPVEEIPPRQEAVRDLAGRLRFREQIASSGETVRNAVHP